LIDTAGKAGARQCPKSFAASSIVLDLLDERIAAPFATGRMVSISWVSSFHHHFC
jgi:hypothetical protein